MVSSKMQTSDEKTTLSVLHDVQLLLNTQQQIWGGVYIHRHFSSSTDMVVLPFGVQDRTMGKIRLGLQFNPYNIYIMFENVHAVLV